MQHLLLAEAAPARLHIGFLQLEWFALNKRAMALGERAAHLVALRAHELAAPGNKALEQCVVAADEAGIEERGERLDVLASGLKRLVDGPYGMADLEPGIPERVQDRVDRLGRPALHQEHDVDVGVAAQLAAAVAAERHQGHPAVAHGDGEVTDSVVQRGRQSDARLAA